ncbi:MAG: glycosyltransferase family 39 protein [Lentisphaerae bacterium]|nr:glycosyltransferase family 39 protein [Lentisphaerota bacterium]MCP4102634.1 glycosyltransferase family 39 protein [Lentisphaerota bacterium]
MENIKKNKITPLFFCFTMALLLIMVLLLLSDIPQRDVAFRYAPMAEAFAKGNWAFAFHPKVPPLHPLLAGIITSVFSCSGFTACKIISGLFFSLSIFPVFGLFRKIFSEKIAFIASFMAILCPYLIRLGYSGLRDSAKEFAVMLTAYAVVAIFSNRNKIINYLFFGFGIGMLNLIRVENIALAGVALIFIFLLDLQQNFKFRIPYRWGFAFIISLLMLAPVLYYNYQVVGLPAPELRTAEMIGKIFPVISNHKASMKYQHQQNSVLTAAALQQIHSKSNISQSQLPEMTVNPSYIKATPKMAGKFIKNLIKGFFPLFFIFVIPVIYFRIKNKQWKQEETVVLVFFLLNIVVVIAPILLIERYLYVSDRYLITAIPLTFGWSAVGVAELYKFLNGRLPSLVLKLSVVGIIAGLILDGANPIIKSFTSRKKRTARKATLAIAEWIKEDFKREQQQVTVKQYLDHYVSYKRPLVSADKLPVLGYLAGGQNVNLDNAKKDYIISSKKICAENTVLVYELRVSGNNFYIWRNK